MTSYLRETSLTVWLAVLVTTAGLLLAAGGTGAGRPSAVAAPATVDERAEALEIRMQVPALRLAERSGGALLTDRAEQIADHASTVADGVDAVASGPWRRTVEAARDLADQAAQGSQTDTALADLLDAIDLLP